MAYLLVSTIKKSERPAIARVQAMWKTLILFKLYRPHVYLLVYGTYTKSPVRQGDPIWHAVHLSASLGMDRKT